MICLSDLIFLDSFATAIQLSKTELIIARNNHSQIEIIGSYFAGHTQPHDMRALLYVHILQIPSKCDRKYTNLYNNDEFTRHSQISQITNNMSNNREFNKPHYKR